MTRVETHAADCPICATHPRHCREREQAELLDDLQAAVALWPKLPPHGPFCACLVWGPAKGIRPCDCDHAARNAARAQTRHLLGMDP